MLTAFARLMDPVSTTTVPADLLAELLASKSTLERELRQRSTTIATLRRELTRAIEAPSVVGQSVVDKMLTLTYSNGRVLQLQPTAEYSDESTEYRSRWVEITPAPETPKAIVAEALAQADADDDSAFDAMFIGGMEVLA